jgi:hypothetical protein
MTMGTAIAAWPPTPMTEKKDDEQVFAVGERTVMTMQSQSFLDEEFGTIARDPSEMLPVPPPPETPAADGQPAAAASPASEDELKRLERKLDALTNMVNSLNRRLDSMDMVLARIASREP